MKKSFMLQFYIWQLESSLLIKHEYTQTIPAPVSMSCYNNSSCAILLSLCCLKTGEKMNLLVNS